MSRHFFDLENEKIRYVDAEGTELDDATMIRSEALRFLASVFKDAVPDAGGRSFVVKVRDEHQRVVFRTTLTLQEDWIEAAATGSACNR
jgi:hypothetical protein